MCERHNFKTEGHCELKAAVLLMTNREQLGIYGLILH